MDNRTARSLRNPYIELCRFAAAMIIAFHHTEKIGGFEFFSAYRIAPGGWIFVEYFFILSGYFMTKHFNRTELKEQSNVEKAAILYTIRKLLKIMPYAAAGIIIDAIAQIGCGDIEKANILNLVTELPLHFLLLKGFSFLRFDINAPLWYLTEILIAIPLIVVFFLHYRRFYKYIASWLFPLVIYTVIFTEYGNIQYWDKSWSINCMLRAFAGLMLGSVTFYLSEYLKTKKFCDRERVFLTILEIGLFGYLTVLSFIGECLTYAIPCVLFSVIFFCIAFCEQEYMQTIIPRQAVYLGQISSALYCLHRPVYTLIRWLCAGVTFFDKVLIAILISLTLSTLMVLITNIVSKSKKNKT